MNIVIFVSWILRIHSAVAMVVVAPTTKRFPSSILSGGGRVWNTNNAAASSLDMMNNNRLPLWQSSSSLYMQLPSSSSSQWPFRRRSTYNSNVMLTPSRPFSSSSSSSYFHTPLKPRTIASLSSLDYDNDENDDDDDEDFFYSDKNVIVQGEDGGSSVILPPIPPDTTSASTSTSTSTDMNDLFSSFEDEETSLDDISATYTNNNNRVSNNVKGEEGYDVNKSGIGPFEAPGLLTNPSSSTSSLSSLSSQESTTTTTATPTNNNNESTEETQRRQIEEQRRQIETLMHIMKSSNPAITTNPPPPQDTTITTPPKSTITPPSSPPNVPQVAPLKAMLFIDGTWLYYSIYQRREENCPIIRQFGRGWQHYNQFDWSILPRIVCEQMQKQQSDQGWTSMNDNNTPLSPTSSSSSTPTLMTGCGRPVEIVRASVYTSYNRSTDKNSLRAKMFEQMGDANYDVHIMETMGKGEKCVDIQLAVEMLHYATVPDAYDVAILLSGDKDFIPAMVRTRQKGKQVGLVSMRTGCNRALYESPHVKDYGVVWLDDFLDRLIRPVDRSSFSAMENGGVGNAGLVSPVTMMKVMYDFIIHSPSGHVSSRDIGRYLKNVEIGNGEGGTTNMLNELKDVHGGLKHFLAQHIDVFQIVERPAQEMRTRDPRDKSFLVEVVEGEVNGEDVMSDLEKRRTGFSSDVEEKFLKDYNERVDDEFAYYHTETDNDATLAFETPKEAYLNKNRAMGGVSSNDDSDDDKGTTIVEEFKLPPDLLVDFTKCTVALLKQRCRDRDLQVSGNKAVLIDRVQDDVKAQVLVLKRKYDEEQEEAKKRRQSSTNTRGGFNSREQQQNNRSHSMKMKPRMQRSNLGAQPSRFIPNATNFSAQQQKPYSTGNSRGPPPQPRTNIDPTVVSHLDFLVKEFISASGGQAGSRDVGRYLAANKPSAKGHEHRSALKELKENYGSLATFLNHRVDTFAKADQDPRRYGDDYGFPIRTKNK